MDSTSSQIHLTRSVAFRFILYSAGIVYAVFVLYWSYLWGCIPMLLVLGIVGAIQSCCLMRHQCLFALKRYPFLPHIASAFLGFVWGALLMATLITVFTLYVYFNPDFSTFEFVGNPA